MAKRLENNDNYYTSTDLARACIEKLTDIAPDCDLYVEPSAGGGAFLDQLPGRTIGLDIAPGASGILKADFLTWAPPEGFDTIAVVGNPPFNCPHGTAIGFFNHAASFAEWIAMILPGSFAKWSVQRQLDPNFECVHHEDMHEAEFYRDGEAVRVNACFQIWRRTAAPRVMPKPATTHADFEFVKDIAQADFAIRRVGGHAGRVIEITPERRSGRGLAPASNYYIRGTAIAAKEVEAVFRSIDPTEARSRTVAVPSISKAELIALYDAQRTLTPPKGRGFDSTRQDEVGSHDLNPERFLGALDGARCEHIAGTAKTERSRLGQFMTPTEVAGTMAEMFDDLPRHVSLLDPGAGMGALSAAFVLSALKGDDRPASIKVTAYEVDPALLPYLERTLASCAAHCAAAGVAFSSEVVNADYILSAPQDRDRQDRRYDCVIANPPYAKLLASADARAALDELGLHATNWYSAFIAVALTQLVDGGTLVAITPRSYCNGATFERFRRHLNEVSAIRALHLYESRSAVFAGDDIVQEVLTIKTVKSGHKSTVRLSSHCGGTRDVPFSDIIDPGDLSQRIHLPISDDGGVAKVRALPCTLADLGVQVSTGRVMPSRLPEAAFEAGEGSVIPLVRAENLRHGAEHYPTGSVGKIEVIADLPELARLRLPAGTYVLVKRISSKDEPRRIQAFVHEAGPVFFENHLNVVHVNGEGVSPDLARGLAMFLNSDEVDRYFRTFSGSTQVNARDLRSLRYPDGPTLEALGRGGVQIDGIW
ncbi:Eco57I restriction-modification methylase domain-containing protein [Pseudooceanicola nanhaiensis]|uniref:Eco57I restriction-modification methylase domain-containing protein n=1 Tax=Pseudooceanicola nanhaiensis TaxID=375761 RepID=UPI003512767F